MLNCSTVKVAFFRLVVFAGLWLVLTGGSLDEWPLALAAVLAATVVSVRLWPGRMWRVSVVGVIRFIPFFLVQSLLGGWDVARRALLPSMPLNPGFVNHTFKLETEAARVFFAWTVSLLPGTASTRLRDGELRIHVLDRLDSVEEKLQRLETYVAALFAEENV